MHKATATMRYEFMDAIRGLAALAVVMAHALQFSNFTTLWDGRFDWIHYGHIGEAGVVLFFFVSGFLIPLSLEKSANLRYFWINRALRIYPLYFFVYFATLAINDFAGIKDATALMWNFMAHAAFIQEFVKQKNFVGGSWTLSLELVWYIGFAFLFLFKINRSLLAVMIITVVTCLVAQLITIYWIRLPMGRLSMLVTCVFGLIHYRRMRAEIDGSTFVKCSVLLWVMIICNIASRHILERATDHEGKLFWQLSPWMFAYMIFLAAFLTRQREIWSHAAMTTIGQISYSLYLMHGFVMFSLAKYNVNGFLFIALTFLFALPLAKISYNYIESPPIRFGRNFRPRKFVEAPRNSS